MKLEKVSRTLERIKAEEDSSIEQLWGLLQDVWDEYKELRMDPHPVSVEAQKRQCSFTWQILQQFHAVQPEKSGLYRFVEEEVKACEEEAQRLEILLLESEQQKEETEQKMAGLQIRLEAAVESVIRIIFMEKTAAVMEEAAASASEAKRTEEISRIVKTGAENILRQSSLQAGRERLQGELERLEEVSKEMQETQKKLEQQLERLRKAYGTYLI